MEDKKVKIDYEEQLKNLCIKDKYELLNKYVELLNEVKQLRKSKEMSRERYNKMSKALITYMDLYGALDKKGNKNGVHK